MRITRTIAACKIATIKPRSVTLALAACFVLISVRTWAQIGIRVVPDRSTYNAGSVARLRVVSTSEKDWQVPLDLVGRLRYAGETEPILDNVPLASSFSTSGQAHSTEYREVWKIPADAKTGRYEVEVTGLDSRSRQVVFKSPVPAASFVVHRKRVRIERVELDKRFYTPGDQVGCSVSLMNLTGRPVTGLIVEFSNRYWPWTAVTSERAAPDIVRLSESLSVAPTEKAAVTSPRCSTAETVKKPTAHQYAVVVWDRERRNVYDIAFSPLLFVHPPGNELPKPYAGPPGFPLQYLFPDLASVNVTSYRHFYTTGSDCSSIEFDRDHTMFVSGTPAEVSFSVRDPTPKPWHAISVRVRWLDPDGRELASQVVERGIDLNPHEPPVKKSVQYLFPVDSSGVYRAEVTVEDSRGEIFAMSSLELGVNPLPKSVLIFCAHEDDEAAHGGIIRAAFENHIPIHIVYFTSGEAGSCDRYYQDSCGPAEALDFGALRMDESRAALGHLGVPRENIYFFGLPDGGSGQIWSNHPDPSNPYLAVLLATDHAPYDGLARPNLPYARSAVVEMAKDFIKKFQPEVIYTGHPDERHVDHRTNNWFVVKALQELIREGALSSIPKLLVDQVYGPGPQRHAPYHYRKHLLSVSGEAKALAQQAGWFYQSQNGNHAQANRRSFDQLPRAEVHWEVLDWKEHEGWNENH